MIIGKLLQDIIVDFGGDISLASGIVASHSVVIEFSELQSIFISSLNGSITLSSIITNEHNHKLYSTLPSSILEITATMGILFSRDGDIRFTIQGGNLEIATELDARHSGSPQELSEAITAFSYVVAELFQYFNK